MRREEVGEVEGDGRVPTVAHQLQWGLFVLLVVFGLILFGHCSHAS